VVTVHAVGGEGEVDYGGCEGEAAELREERAISNLKGEVDQVTYEASGEAHCCW